MFLGNSLSRPIIAGAGLSIGQSLPGIRAKYEGRAQRGGSTVSKDEKMMILQMVWTAR